MALLHNNVETESTVSSSMRPQNGTSSFDSLQAPVMVISSDSHRFEKSASFCEVYSYPIDNAIVVAGEICEQSESWCSVSDESDQIKLQPTSSSQEQHPAEASHEPIQGQIPQKDDEMRRSPCRANPDPSSANELDSLDKNQDANSTTGTGEHPSAKNNLNLNGHRRSEPFALYNKYFPIINGHENELESSKKGRRHSKGIFPSLLANRKKSVAELKSRENLSVKSRSKSVHLLSFLGLSRGGTYHVPDSTLPNTSTVEEYKILTPTVLSQHEHPEADDLSNIEYQDSSAVNAIPDLDDRIQTTFKVLLRLPELEDLFIVSEIPEQDEYEEEAMDPKRTLQAPMNPPPPVPNHNGNKRNQQNIGGYEIGSNQPISDQKYGTLRGSTDQVYSEKSSYNHSNTAFPLKNISNQNGHHVTSSTYGQPITNTMGKTSATSAPQGKSNGVHKPNGVDITPTNFAEKDNVKEKVIPELKLNGIVGFDTLPYQLVKKCQDKGFQFNIMCVGETGMGKTTLIESLFNLKVEFPPCNNELKTVELRTQCREITEGGVRVKLRVVETAGFGDQLDKDKRLKTLDVVTMKELSMRVNVIPVIAKADTACKDELVRFKQKILSELKSQNIEIYQFPVDDETVRKENSALNGLLPFAIVGSIDFVAKEDGRMVRARRYPWGMVEVENEEHCDFVKLREAMLRINEDSLRERTHSILYERYRRERLREMKMRDGDAGPKMAEAFQLRQKEFKEEMKKREDQYEKEFLNRVSRKDAELKSRDEIMNYRQRDIASTFDEDSKKMDLAINSLLEEKAKLENSRHNSGTSRKIFNGVLVQKEIIPMNNELVSVAKKNVVLSGQGNSKVV